MVFHISLIFESSPPRHLECTFQIMSAWWPPSCFAPRATQDRSSARGPAGRLLSFEPGSLPCRGPLGQPASINGARTSGICNAQAALTGVRAAHVQEGLRPRGRRLFANWGARISRTPHWWGGGAGGNRTRVLERRSRSSPGAVSVVAFLGPGARTDTSPTGPARMKSRSLLLAGSDQQVL